MKNIKEKLLKKESDFVAKYMLKSGYVVSCEYEKEDNFVVEFAKTLAGATVKNVNVIFNPNWQVVDVIKW